MAVFSGNGTDTAPSFTFSSDTDTGMYRGASSDELRLVTGGTDAISISPTQSVTIASSLQAANFVSTSGTLTDTPDSSVPAGGQNLSRVTKIQDIGTGSGYIRFSASAVATNDSDCWIGTRYNGAFSRDLYLWSARRGNAAYGNASALGAVFGQTTAAFYTGESGNFATSPKLTINKDGQSGFGTTNPSYHIDSRPGDIQGHNQQGGIIKLADFNTQFNSFRGCFGRVTSNASPQTFLTFTAEAATFSAFFELTAINSRAPIAGGNGTSRVGKFYIHVGRNGSGSDVVITNNIGSKDWEASSTTAGGGFNAGSLLIDAVRLGAEPNTDSQEVGFRVFNSGGTGGTFYATILVDAITQSGGGLFDSTTLDGSFTP